MQDWTNKKVLVMGYARSGKAAIAVLRKLGAKITLSDRNEPKDKEQLEALGVKVVGQSEEIFAEPFDLCVKNPGVPPVSPLVARMHELNIPIITEIELAYQVSKPQHYFAITGTNGKTTTTTLAYEFLKKRYGDKALVGGNIGTPLCELVMQHDLFNNAGYYIALEISNHQLVDIDRFHPEVATITNLTPDHLETMGSLDNYYRSKTEVYRNMSGQDLFILNGDDETLFGYVARYPFNCAAKTISIERSNTDSFIKDDWLYIDLQKTLPLSEIRLVGRHNLQNILIAATGCHHLGVSCAQIREVVASFAGVEHRIEFVRELNGVTYYNDSKGTNTDATITALKSFTENVILLVGGYEKGLAMDEMRKYLSPVKKVIGYGAAGPRIAKDLVGEAAKIVADLQAAVAYAHQIAEPGDIVLLSPTTSSFDQYSGYEERGRHFKELVNKL